MDAVDEGKKKGNEGREIKCGESVEERRSGQGEEGREGRLSLKRT